MSSTHPSSARPTVNSDTLRPESDTAHALPAVSPRGTALPPLVSRSRSSRIERALLRRLLHQCGDPALIVALWDGREISTSSARDRVRLRIADRRTLWKLARDPQLEFGEGYSEGRIEVQGSLVAALRAVQPRLIGPKGRAPRSSRVGARWSPLRARDLSAARDNIHRHYDIGNHFYKLWLDERMLYTCAYYADPAMTLEQAQVAKMDHVCRKLQLQPGETVIEAGCGWGGFALHMARQWGVTVRAFNISHEQITYARETARRENLDGRVEFLERDWREIDGTCDAFVSIGMLEHVGIENYRELGRVISRCLHPQGRGLIHTIGRNYPEPLNRWIGRRIFPGAAPPALSEMTAVFEEQNLSVLDLENIRLHYAVTLGHWLQRFEESVDEVRQMYDDRFVRMWRLYLASSMTVFELGGLQLFQVLFAPGTSNLVPWTRNYQYVSGAHPERGTVWREMRQGDV